MYIYRISGERNNLHMGSRRDWAEVGVAVSRGTTHCTANGDVNDRWERFSAILHECRHSSTISCPKEARDKGPETSNISTQTCSCNTTFKS